MLRRSNHREEEQQQNISISENNSSFAHYLLNLSADYLLALHD